MKLKKNVLLIGQILICCCLSSCDDEQAAAPPCPECWDEKALCVESACECPEGAIEIRQYLFSSTKQAVGEDGLKFCVIPDPLTFIARFPQFECYDTFALSFPLEPLEYGDWPHSPSGHIIQVQIPDRFQQLGRLAFSMNEEEDNGLFVVIPKIPPNHGERIGGCLEYDDEGVRTGGITAEFQGYFTHKDTISGDLVFTGSGTMEHLSGHRLPIQLVRTVPY